MVHGPMLPLSDVIPSRRTPIVTYTTALLTTAVFALQMLAGADFGADAAYLSAPYDESGGVPAAAAAVALLAQPGGVQWLVNVLLLRVFGETLEDRLGRLRFALLVAAAGLATAYANARLQPAASPALASSLVAGVLGGYFVLYPQSKVLTLAPVSAIVIEVPAVFYLAFWWMVELLGRISEAPGQYDAAVRNPALWSLAAGFVAGALLSKALRRPLVWD